MLERARLIPAMTAFLLLACQKGEPGPPPPASPPAAPEATSATPALAEPTKPTASGDASAGRKAGVANPASVNCVKKGGKLDFKTTPDGESIYSVCIFEDGSRCDQWHFFRDECKPGTCRSENGICK